MNFFFVFLLGLVVYIFNFAFSSVPVETVNIDLVHSLPGQPTPVDFRQHAGYITVDEKGERHLFYYFVECTSNPRLKPLVLWLTGGPGCSSVGVGAFSEHGPFWPMGNALIRNNHSWNTEANILYLESPAGVGFSYSTNKGFYTKINDNMTAWDNLRFLEKWVAKHPMFKNHDLIIAGESYGGHFVPQLANLVLKSNLSSNLKGILIGNPLMDFGRDFNSRAPYLWSHGLMSDATLKLSESICNFSQLQREYMNGNLSTSCWKVAIKNDDEMGPNIDMYDISAIGLCHGPVSRKSRPLHPMTMMGVDLCIADEVMTYLNRTDVQMALHANIGDWSICSRVANYDVQELEVTSIPSIAAVLKSGIRVRIYSGDADSILPFIGTRTQLEALAKTLNFNQTDPYRPWLEGPKVVGGWTEEYGHLLSFATIKGAGHEAPYTQPHRSLVVFGTFIRGESLPRLIKD